MNYLNQHVPILVIVLIFFSLTSVYGQFQERALTREAAAELQTDSYFSKPLQLIDMPTGSILRGGDIGASLELYELGGMLGRLSVGISQKIMFGVSFGGLHIIGADQVVWNPSPAVHFAYRLVDESLNSPSMVIGFDSQGFGPYWKKEGGIPGITAENTPSAFSNRYTIKSRGFYFVTSKNYQTVVKTGLHGGINYSLENKDGEKGPDVFCGFDFRLGRDLAICCEYDFALNDGKVRGVNNGKGYLNAGFRWAFSESMYLEFDGKDFLAKKSAKNDFSRIIKIVYHGSAL
jgi:hypothetical protein